tara:strand:- start:164 stop:721 length:558 start_codon:yes stop_codon:yes gene_type:complete
METVYKADQGTAFGKWKDTVSQFMYFDSVKPILSKINIPNKVADFGGANGNLKEFVPNIITIDRDASKNPDIVANILDHKEHYELVIIRYVLHYLTDYEVLQLFENINADNVLVIQFTNDDLKSKYFNSRNEFKYFRTKVQLEKLLPKSKLVYSEDYTVTEDFYKNRLQIDNSRAHVETLNAYYI